MILLGGPVLCQKGVVSERRRAWEYGFGTDVDNLLSEKTLDDYELAQGLINRFHFEPISIDLAANSGEGFQLVSAFDGLEGMYSFTRQIHYTGTQALWKQMPYRGFKTNVRIKMNATGEAYLSGYCVKADQERVDLYLRGIREELARYLWQMAPMLNTYNADLEASVGRYIVANHAVIERKRSKTY